MTTEPRIDWDAVEAFHTETLRWVTRQPQPAGAACSHHGLGGAYCGAGLSLSAAYWTSETVVLVHDLRRDNDQYLSGVVLPQVEWGFKWMLMAELKAIIRTVYGADAIIDEWNGGEGSPTWSVRVQVPVSADAYRVLRHYADGCPEHGGPFCNGWQNGDHNKGCTYMSDALAKLVRPVYRNVPREQAPPKPPPPDRMAVTLTFELDGDHVTIVNGPATIGRFPITDTGFDPDEAGGYLIDHIAHRVNTELLEGRR